MSWNPKAGAKQYRFEVSTTQAVNPDGSFSNTFEQITTDTTSAAPTMQYTYAPTGTAARSTGTWPRIVADGDVGAYSAIQTLTLPMN